SLSGSHAPIGSMATIDDYIFTAPPGWTGTKYTDALTFSAVGNGSERCFMSIYPMRAPGPSLEQDANKAFAEAYRGLQQRNQDGPGAAMPPVMIRGTSGQGWDYVIVKRGIAPPNSPEVRLGFAMVARLGDREAAISGLSKDPLVSFCFGELARNVWPAFFYSLSFRGWNAAAPSATLNQRMAGTWTVASASVADQITFSPNGRYGGASARQQYNVVNNSEVVATTQGFFGDGAYVLQGNHITMKRDNGTAEPGLIRVEEESHDEGRTWAPVLYLMRRSYVRGSEYGCCDR